MCIRDSSRSDAVDRPALARVVGRFPVKSEMLTTHLLRSFPSPTVGRTRPVARLRDVFRRLNGETRVIRQKLSSRCALDRRQTRREVRVDPSRRRPITQPPRNIVTLQGATDSKKDIPPRVSRRGHNAIPPHRAITLRTFLSIRFGRAYRLPISLPYPI